MPIVRNALEYLAGVDLIKSANRHATTVAEFELNKDQIRKDRSQFQKYALAAFVMNQVINVVEVLNLGLMASRLYDSIVKMQNPSDEIFVATIPYIMCISLLESARFLSKKSVFIKEDSERRSYVSRLYFFDAVEQHELERQYSDRDKDWKEAEDEYTDG